MWPLYSRGRNEWYHYQREPEIGIAFYLSFVGSIICAIWMVTFNFFLVWDLTGSGYVVGQDTLLSQSLSSTRSINGYWGSVKEAWWNTWDKFVMDWHSFPSPPPPSLGNSNTPSHFMLQKLGWAPAWWATWLEYRRNHVWTVLVFSL